MYFITESKSIGSQSKGGMKMAKTRTFVSIVRDTFFGDIEKAVERHVEEHFLDMKLHEKSYRIKRVDEAFVQQSSLHRVIAYDSLDDTLVFDAVVIADIAIFQTSHSQAVEDDTERWFRVNCEVDVGDDFHNLRIKDINDYDHSDNNIRKMLDDSLVPFIHAVDLENHAEAILLSVYPEALAEPTRIDVRLFAEWLGLIIDEDRRLSRNGTIFGQMIFHDATVEYFDLDSRRFDTFEATGGTILADPEIYFLRSLGSWNNTVIHECVHWLKHRKHIELERSLGADVSRISCQVAEPSSSDENRRSQTEWMEWHANALAPRILMPRKPFKQKADELVAWYKLNGGLRKTADIMTVVICDLSDFFEVSVQSAKIRMIDIGYTEAIGVLEYVDGGYAPSHSYSHGAIGKDQTYTIPMKEGLFQYAVNLEFRQIIDSGNFVYIDGHYCINDPRYITQNENGVLEMTQYAIDNIDECCLVFKRTSAPNPEYGAGRYSECVLYQSAVAKTIPAYGYSHSDQSKPVDELLAEIKEANEAAKVIAQLPRGFGSALTYLIKWRKSSNEKLAEKALLHPRSIQRMRNEPNYTHKLETVIAICIGLQLYPKISLELLDSSGFALKNTEKDILYFHIIKTRYKSTIHECNELLTAAGYPILTGDE